MKQIDGVDIPTIPDSTAAPLTFNAINPDHVPFNLPAAKIAVFPRDSTYIPQRPVR